MGICTFISPVVDQDWDLYNKMAFFYHEGGKLSNKLIDWDKITDDIEIIVCSKCLKAGCWGRWGDYCDSSSYENRTKMTIKELKLLNRELDTFWDDQWLVKQGHTQEWWWDDV